MSREILLNRLPVIAIVADLSAIRVNWQDAVKLFDFCQRTLQLSYAPGESCLKIDYPDADQNARSQFIRVVGFGEIVISSGLDAFDDFPRAMLRSHQDDVGSPIEGPKTTANLQTVHLRHHDIQQGNVGCFR